MSTFAKRLNAGLDLTSKLAVVAGGSQGIGAGVAVRLAQAGSSVIIVGRNESLMSKVVGQCKNAAKGGASGKTFDFIRADLSGLQGIKQAVKDIKSKSNGSVNYLFQSQGGPPNGKFVEKDGSEFHFLVQVLSRFTLSDRLAEEGVLKESSVNVAAPGMDPKATEFDIEDLEGRKLQGKNIISRIVGTGNAQSTITDAYTKALQTKYPQISFFHIFPGIVATNSAANQGFPFPLPQLFSLASPILSRTIGNSPESYADIPVLLGCNSSKEKQDLVAKEGNFLGSRITRCTVNPWATDTTNQEAIYAKLQAYTA